MEAKPSVASIWKDGWNPNLMKQGSGPAVADPATKKDSLDSIDSAPKPGADLPFRPKPRVLQDLGLPEIFVADLFLKHCFYMKIFTLPELRDRLKLPTSIISDVLDYLQMEEYLEIRGPDPLKPASGPMGLSNRYALTDGGRKRAAQLLEYDAYVGPVPVSLEDYWRQVESQSLKSSPVTLERLRQSFEGLVIYPDMLEKLGPASVSGKPLFLYGPPGNGKTTIALRMGQVWDDAILVPYAIFVEGNVIRVFDEINHKPVANGGAPHSNGEADHRWVACRRPTVIVGGELTVDMMDLSFNPTMKYYEAPLQLKANNGLFIVDDLGRQRLPAQELLNRWIIPLENRQDFLCLHTGQKFAIPFDQFIIFATNIEPHKLMDAAFLRRIRAKVKVNHVTRQQFKEIFHLVCRQHGLHTNGNLDDMAEYLLTAYYDDGRRPMDACHPRDLIEQIVDYCTFHRLPPELNRENLDRACEIYFVE
ncbi:MAG: ATPase [Deltaproteobacteria bacterium]|nr:ATPase [Deltaproteobacteria bacterium]